MSEKLYVMNNFKKLSEENEERFPGVLEEKKVRKLFIESYGCAMNFADSEVVASIMAEVGVVTTNDEMEADIIFINTCSIRDNAEQRIRNRLKHLRHNKRQNKDRKHYYLPRSSHTYP